MRDKRPTYCKSKLRKGGTRACPECGRVHKLPMRVNGKLVWPRECATCEAELPRKITYPPRARIAWIVRKYDPAAGGVVGSWSCRSREAADALIRELEHAWELTPVQQEVSDVVMGLLRQIQPTSTTEGIDELIRRLGGDPATRKIQAVPMARARDAVCEDLRLLDRAADRTVEDLGRCIGDLVAITGIETADQLDADTVRDFRRGLNAGGWKRAVRALKRGGQSRGDREMRPLSSRSVRRNLMMLRMFVIKAADREWLDGGILGEPKLWSQEVEDINVAYMPHADFHKLVKQGDTFGRALILVAYNGAARRSDLLALHWADIDLDGSKAEENEMPGPSIQIENVKDRKRKRRRRILLHPATIEALKALKERPMAYTRKRKDTAEPLAAIDERVFPVRFATPGPELSRYVERLCIAAKLINPDGSARWSLQDLRVKRNQDALDSGGSLREAMALTGHRSVRVNVQHYQPANQEAVARLTRDNTAMGELAG